MTLDGFLTFVAVIAAMLALASPVTGLVIRIRRFPLLATTAAGFLSVMYFEFFNLVKQPCFLASVSICNAITLEGSRLSPEKAAFLVIVFWTIVTLGILLRSKIGVGAFESFSSLISELLHEERYIDVIKFVQPQLPIVSRAYHRQLPTQRLYDWLQGQDPNSGDLMSVLDLLEREEAEQAPAASREALRIFSKVRRIVPAGRRAKANAENILREIFRSPDLTKFVAHHRPEFGIDLLRQKIYFREGFADKFFTYLMANSESLLYREIQGNQNLDRVGYAIPPYNRLLYFLFDDAEVANELGVWKPVGDYDLAVLKNDQSYAKFLNGPADNFNDECWRDATWLTITFFDVMVGAALKCQIKWHMWLYYFPPILKELVALYDVSGEGVDKDAEFPTRRARVIYELFHTILRWITVVVDLPTNSVHLALNNLEPTHDNANIPKSAIVALGFCLDYFLLAESIPSKFKTYIFDIVIRRVRDLPVDGALNGFRKVLIKSILKRGALGTSANYGEVIRRHFEQIDPLLRYEVQDFSNALDELYPVGI